MSKQILIRENSILGDFAKFCHYNLVRIIFFCRGVTPCLEKNSPDRLIPSNPQKYVGGKKTIPLSVPALFGFNANEGNVFLGTIIASVMRPQGLTDDPVYLSHQIIVDLLQTFKDPRSGNGTAVEELKERQVTISDIQIH